MTQLTNLEIEKFLQYLFTSNKIVVIRKWSRKWHSIIKRVLKVSNDAKLMLSYVSWKLHYL